MIDIHFDVESTGLNPYCDEIIEAFFYIDETNFYHLKAKPLNWSYEAQEIHKITYEEAMRYPDKKEAYRDFLKWLPKDFRFITYANKNTELGHLNYDVAILENELNLLGCKPYYLKNTHNMHQNMSVHTLARVSAKNGLFQPLKSSKGRQTLKQEAVYYALFNMKYNAHNAKEDVLALVRIHKELIRLKNENSNIFNWNKASNS